MGFSGSPGPRRGLAVPAGDRAPARGVDVKPPLAGPAAAGSQPPGLPGEPRSPGSREPGPWDLPEAPPGPSQGPGSPGAPPDRGCFTSTPRGGALSPSRGPRSGRASPPQEEGCRGGAPAPYRGVVHLGVRWAGRPAGTELYVVAVWIGCHWQSVDFICESRCILLVPFTEERVGRPGTTRAPPAAPRTRGGPRTPFGLTPAPLQRGARIHPSRGSRRGHRASPRGVDVKATPLGPRRGGPRGLKYPQKPGKGGKCDFWPF